MVFVKGTEKGGTKVGRMGEIRGLMDGQNATSVLSPPGRMTLAAPTHLFSHKQQKSLKHLIIRQWSDGNKQEQPIQHSSGDVT